MAVFSELTKDVEELIVSNTNYGISMQELRKTMGKLIQGSRLYDRELNRNEPDLNQKLSIT